MASSWPGEPLVARGVYEFLQETRESWHRARTPRVRLRESRALRDRVRKPGRMRLGGGQALIAADMENLPPAKKFKIFKG